MDDRFKYAEVRQKIIDAIRTDLIGPLSPEEVLDENPRFAYLVGMLEPQRDENAPDENEQEIDTDIDYGKDEDFTAGEDDDNEPVSTTKFQLPSSLGISFLCGKQSRPHLPRCELGATMSVRSKRL